MLNRIMRFGLVLLLMAAPGFFGCSDSTDSDPGDDTGNPPTVGQSTPADGAEQVDTDPEITITFSEAMNRSSVEDATSFESADRADVPFEMYWMGNSCLIEADDYLQYDTDYTITIGVDAESADGVNLDEAWVLNFSTLSADPVVLNHSPAAGAVGVATNIDPWIIFNHPMNMSSLETAITLDPAIDFDLQEDDEDGFRVTLEMTADFATTTAYTVTVGTGAQAENGNFLAEAYSFGFTTGDGADNEPPSIASWSPASGSTGVARDFGDLVITFSEPIRPETVQPALMDARFIMAMPTGQPEWNGDFTQISLQLQPLPPGITLWIDLGPFEDLAGNESADPAEWSISLAGNVDWFPSGANDFWTGVEWDREEGNPAGFPEEYEDRIEDLNGGQFSISRYHYYSGPAELTGKTYFTKLSNRIQLRGFAEEDEGVWTEFPFTPAADWLLLPPSNQTWNGTSAVDMGDDLSNAELAYSGEVLGFEDLTFDVSEGEQQRQGQPFSDRAEDDWAVLRDCAKVRVTHEISGDIPDERGMAETIVVHSGVDTLWYAPGAGILLTRGHSSDMGEGMELETTYYTEQVYWWSVGQ